MVIVLGDVWYKVKEVKMSILVPIPKPPKVLKYKLRVKQDVIWIFVVVFKDEKRQEWKTLVGEHLRSL